MLFKYPKITYCHSKVSICRVICMKTNFSKFTNFYTNVILNLSMFCENIMNIW